MHSGRLVFAQLMDFFPRSSPDVSQQIVPAAAAGTTTPDGSKQIFNTNAVLLASHTLALPGPATARDGQQVSFATNGGITALTVTAAGWGNGVVGAPATLAAGGFATFTCSLGFSGWYRSA